MNETSFKAMLEKMDLHEIERLKLAKQAVTWLEGRRRALEEQLAAVDEQIVGVKEGRLDPSSVLPKSGTAPVEKGEPRRRRATEGALTKRIAEVLIGKESGMEIDEITKAVLDAGYQTKSKNFRQQVMVALGSTAEVERVGRGLYRMKGVA
ncbi:MAG: hypothetical protein FJ395_13315 [Verrucomicrobia bacterium]|nr:hypothetical protein [Verrucomicrobiota bacterium]